MRAKIKPPLEVVVGNLVLRSQSIRTIAILRMRDAVPHDLGGGIFPAAEGADGLLPRGHQGKSDRLQPQLLISQGFYSFQNE